AGQLAEAAFFTAGQDCTAVTRVLAHESIAPALTTALVAAARATRPGPPSDPEAFSGPLITRAHLSRTADVLDRLPSRIEVVAGGAPLPGPGFFFAPTVLLGARQSDEVVQRELFAPVVTVQTFGAEDKAVLLANGVRQALTASVWTADHARAHRLVPRLRAGCVWVNAHMRFAAEMPHGGPGASGHGRDLSRYAVDDYTSLKHVMHRFDDR
uniref:aldehyde dehydrogenase family protein n=1 Tax=Actinosynnema sp. TaxID=1872144 RepID=UPI003F833CDC